MYSRIRAKALSSANSTHMDVASALENSLWHQSFSMYVRNFADTPFPILHKTAVPKKSTIVERYRVSPTPVMLTMSKSKKQILRKALQLNM